MLTRITDSDNLFLLLFADFPDYVDYLANSGKQKVASQANLQWCPEDSCVPDSVTLQMQLATKHIGKGCDRDTYSITSQRKLCGKNTCVCDVKVLCMLL